MACRGAWKRSRITHKSKVYERNGEHMSRRLQGFGHQPGSAGRSCFSPEVAKPGGVGKFDSGGVDLRSVSRLSTCLFDNHHARVRRRARLRPMTESNHDEMHATIVQVLDGPRSRCRRRVSIRARWIGSHLSNATVDADGGPSTASSASRHAPAHLGPSGRTVLHQPSSGRGHSRAVSPSTVRSTRLILILILGKVPAPARTLIVRSGPWIEARAATWPVLDDQALPPA